MKQISKIAVFFFIILSLWSCNESDVPEYHEGVFIKDWLLLGPLPNCPDCSTTNYVHGKNCTGFFTDYLDKTGGEPNAKPDISREIVVNDTLTLKWSKYHSLTDLIRLTGIMKPKDLVVAYGFSRFYSPRAQKAILSVGSNDGVMVYLNGEKVHEYHPEHGRGLKKDSDFVPVSLKKGDNKLLIKVDQGTGDWGFAVRLLDYDSITSMIRQNIDRFTKLRLVLLDNDLHAEFGIANKITVLNPEGEVTFELSHEKLGKIDQTKAGPGDDVLFSLEGRPEGLYTVKATFPLPDEEDLIRESAYHKGALPRHPRPERLLADRVIADNSGKPFFPIGTYGAPVEDYPALKDAGFNFVVGSVANLDEAHKEGLMVAVHINGHNIRAARDTIMKYKDHPAVLCWMMYDEPGYNRADMLHIYKLYNTVYEADHVHPSYLVITNPKVYKTFGRMCDVLAVDVYPVPNGVITDVGDNIALAYRHIADDQSVWHCGQLFHWPALRYPTPHEHRFMTYIALIEGVKGMLWYTYKGYNHYLPQDAHELWQAHTKILRQLNDLAPLFLAPGFGKNISTTDNNPEIRAIIKSSPTGTFLIAANKSKTETFTAEFETGIKLNGEIQVYDEFRAVKAVDGKFSDKFKPLDVHIYKLNR